MKLPLFYLKRVTETTHSFKFIEFLQNRNCSIEITILIMTPPWFQACIYWKKSVIWRHHFQPPIFSMIVSLFHGRTWDNLHVKKTVFISQHLLQSSIIASGLWLIREKLICLVEENYCSPALLKVPIYSAELATIIFVWKVLS